jgi:hypothetical protein
MSCLRVSTAALLATATNNNSRHTAIASPQSRPRCSPHRPTAHSHTIHHVAQHVDCKHARARTRCGVAADATATVGAAAEPAPLQLAVWWRTGPPRVAKFACRRGFTSTQSHCLIHQCRGGLHGQQDACTRPQLRGSHFCPGCTSIYAFREPPGPASSSAEPPETGTERWSPIASFCCCLFPASRLPHA